MTIRLAILSDLHVEKGPYVPPPLDVDLVVLAGDVGWGLEGVAWIAAHLSDRPVIYVAGNREYWRHEDGKDSLAELRRCAARLPDLRLLQDEAAELRFGGRSLRVLGCTLWTDYALTGDPDSAMAGAQAAMPDYRDGRGPGGAALTAAQVLAWNRASVAFLEAALARPFAGTTMVITHHLPSARSLKAPRPDHIPTTASVTRLDALIERAGPALWVHGHSHWDCDYTLAGTRIVSRQRGGPENQGYQPLIIEI